jgi:hypothetical protein
LYENALDYLIRAVWFRRDSTFTATSIAFSRVDGLSVKLGATLRWCGWRAGSFPITRRLPTYFTQQPQYRRRFSISVETVTQQMPEIIDAALRPMYDAFDFFRLPADLTTKEVAAWRSGN